MQSLSFSALKDHYHKYGYIVLKQVFDEDYLQHLESIIDQIYLPWRETNAKQILNNKLVNMHSLTLAEYSDAESRINLFNAISPTPLVNATERLFGEGIRFHNTQLFFNPTNPSLKPYWHRDLQFSDIEEETQRDELTNMLALHVRIPFIDENSIEVVFGSHRRWDTEQEKNTRLSLNSHKNSDALSNTHRVKISRGDVLIFNAQMIHRGHYNQQTERKALDLCVGKYHPLTQPFLNPDVSPTAEELAFIDNKAWFSAY